MDATEIFADGYTIWMKECLKKGVGNYVEIRQRTS